MIGAIILGVLSIIAAVYFLLVFRVKYINKEKSLPWLICAGIFALLGGFCIGANTSDTKEFSANKYYLDYKIVTTQVDNFIVKDTTYILTKK